MFAGAIVMAISAVSVTYWTEHRKKRGKEKLGKILVELSQLENRVYDASDSEYHRLRDQTEEIKKNIGEIAKSYFDSSLESRFLAANVLDIRLDEPTRDHFIRQGRGSYWTMYQQVRVWRITLKEILHEL